jgi:lipid-A-disaccharide synthase
VKTIAHLVNTIGVILPFEEKYYQDRGVNARYVGHPLLDTVRTSKNREVFCRENNLDQSLKIVGILPGSRKKEVSRLLPVFLESARRLCLKSSEKLIFLVPCASTINERDLYDNGIEKFQKEQEIHIIFEERYNMMAACDIVIAASGTVTLELLLLNTPMVVAYMLTPLTYALGRMLVKVKYFALANLIADKEIVPELLQEEANVERISSELLKLLFDTPLRSKMKADFKMVQKLLGEPGASDRAAILALELLNTQ